MRWLPLFSRSPVSSSGRAHKTRPLPARGLLTFDLLEDRIVPSLTITPTFDSTIANDRNAAAIEGTINSAISFYENAFANPIDVTIDFQEGGGLGANDVTFYKIPYTTFRAALAAEPQTADTATALANLPIQTDNPVNNGADLLIKTADIRALGIPGSYPPHGGFDGVITLNTALTTPGSPGSSGQFSLLATTEHEIDEVLGLGSALPATGSASFPPSDPYPEDLYRYTAEGARTWIVTGDDAWFSLDGTTDLVQFNQGNVNGNEGDYGDWWSNNGLGNDGANPPPRVQDAFSYPGASPTLGTDAGHVELTALNVIGYTPLATLSPGSLPADTIDVAYNQAITTTSGTGSETFAVTNVQNPIAGLNVPAAATGTLPITGTPAATGTETFTVTATDQAGDVTDADYSITVNPAVTLSPTSLPSGYTFALYNPAIMASDGTGALTLAIANYQDGGTGLSAPTITGNQATFDSTPSAPGTVSFDLTATDAVGAQSSVDYTFTIIAAPTIATTALATYWTIDAPGYDQTIAAHGGTGTLTFSVSAGALPPGLTLDPANGLLAGTPTAAGSFPFAVTVTDALGISANQAYTVAIVPSEFSYDSASKTLTITSDTAFPNFQFTQATTANAAGASTVYTFTLSDNADPPNTVSQAFPDSALSTVAAPVVLVNGNGGTAVLITNDTYKDASGATEETPERVSLGSLANANVGELSKFVNNDPDGTSYEFLSLVNFPISYAYVGRNDGTVNLYGTVGEQYNGFVSAGNYSYIAGPGFYHEAQGAPSVYGYSANQPADFAYHYSANAGSAFVVSGVAFSYMSCTDQNPNANNATQAFFNVGVGFTQNTGVSRNPGQDFAYIIDSPANDTFVGGDSYSYMFSTNAAGSFTEFDAAFAFALVYAESFVGGTDTAINNVPSKNILGGNWHVP